MQRRKFILLSAVAGTATAFAGIQCNNRPPAIYSVLEKPQILSEICDEQTIREIGLAYLLQNPEEQTAAKLAANLLTDQAGGPLSSSADEQFVRTLVSRKVEMDFEKSYTVVLKGWILAVTEGRQCALFAVQHH